MLQPVRPCTLEQCHAQQLMPAIAPVMKAVCGCLHLPVRSSRQACLTICDRCVHASVEQFTGGQQLRLYRRLSATVHSFPLRHCKLKGWHWGQLPELLTEPLQDLTS